MKTERDFEHSDVQTTTTPLTATITTVPDRHAVPRSYAIPRVETDTSPGSSVYRIYRPNASPLMGVALEWHSLGCALFTRPTITERS